MNNSDKTNLTKRSLIVSILAMTVCIAMLAGTTFAWFTDSASTSVNRIQAGDLKISASVHDLKTETENLEGSRNDAPVYNFGYVFLQEGNQDTGISLSFSEAAENFENSSFMNGTLFEPGKRFVKLIRVKNEGNLAAKIKINFDIKDNGLQNALWFALAADNSASDDKDYQINRTSIQEFNTQLSEKEIVILPNAADGESDNQDNYVDIVFAYGMNSGASDIYQGKSMEIAMNLVATQYTQESDSFGSDYDAEAEYPVMTAEDFISAVDMIGNNGSGIITLGKDITLTDTHVIITGEKNVAVNTNGHTLKSIWTPASASSAFTVAEGSTLSLVGSGKVEAYAENPDVTWAAGYPGYANNAIDNKGTVIVDGATIKVTTDKVGQNGQLGASYCIDNYAGSKLEVKSGEIINPQNIAIRLFTSDANESVDVDISGGKIEGTRAIWLQLAGGDSSIAPKVNLKINGGEIKTNETFDGTHYCLALYSYSYGNSFANTNVTINGGDFLGYVAFGGGYKGDRETVTINGGTFTAYKSDGTTIDNDCVGRYTSTEPYWESIAH